MRTSTFVSTLLSSLLALAFSGPALAADSTGSVIKAIEAKDCVAAVRELNLALATGTPEALMLGGAMFEQGLCLKPNLERAARFYLRAGDAGAASARARQAALYALPAAGPDKGAALWWGMQADLPLPKGCIVDKEIRGNAERFAQVLSSWPAGQLEACVYVTGVLASLDAEFVLKPYSPDAVGMNFEPASGKLDFQAGKQVVALIDNSPRVTSTNSLFASNNVTQSATPEQMQALQAQENRQTLVKRAETVGKNALARYPKPNGISTEWRVQMSVDSARVQ